VHADKPVFFCDVNVAPPCGFYFESHGERVFGKTFVSIEPKVRKLMDKYGLSGTPEMVVAAYMCPRLDDPARYCRGQYVEVPHVTASEAFSNSLPYCRKNVVPFDKIARRETACIKCPKHRRDWCPTCTGHPDRLNVEMGGRRPSIPEDKMTGVCDCARAYEYAIASVEYGQDEQVWEGAPGTCWRFQDV